MSDIRIALETAIQLAIADMDNPTARCLMMLEDILVDKGIRTLLDLDENLKDDNADLKEMIRHLDDKDKRWG